MSSVKGAGGCTAVDACAALFADTGSLVSPATVAMLAMDPDAVGFTRTSNVTVAPAPGSSGPRAQVSPPA